MTYTTTKDIEKRLEGTDTSNERVEKIIHEREDTVGMRA